MRGQPARFVDFRGGVNVKASPYLVDEREARDARNVVTTIRGSIRKRDGCQTFSSPAVECMSLHIGDAATPKVMVGVTSGNDIIKIDSAGAASSIKGAATVTNARWEAVQAPQTTGTIQGPYYTVNGVDTPLQWTGSGNVAAWTLAAGAIPNPKYLAFHGNRVFMANLTASTGLYGTLSDPGSAFCFSAIGDPRTFPAANIVLLDPGDGDQITGMAKVGPYLVVFKRRKMFLVYDPDTGANRRVSDSVGCVANRSIAESPYGTFFLTADRGVYRTDGNSIALVSDNIAPTLAGIGAGQRANAAGIYFNDHYYLSVSVGGVNNDLTCDLDATVCWIGARARTRSTRYILESWWLHTFAANQWAIMRYTNIPELFGANSGAATVSRCFVPGVTQDNVTNYTSYWKGPWQTFGAPFLGKRIRQIHLDGTGPFDVYLGRDFVTGDQLAKSNVCATSTSTYGGADAFGGGGVYGDASNTQQDRVFTQGVARAWSVGFQATTSAAMEIDSYTLSYTMRRN